MEERWSLRPATADDLAPILEIERQAQRPPWKPWTEDQFRAELSKPYSHFLVMTDDETDSKVAAFIVFWTLYDECQVLTLAVDLPHRGIGMAKAMLRKAASIASQKGIRKLVLEVRKSNQPAIQLYQNINFVVTHVRRGFYSDGEDAYQMTLSLDDDGIEF